MKKKNKRHCLMLSDMHKPLINLFKDTKSPDPNFTKLCDDVYIKNREFINYMFNEKYAPYADKDFVSRFPTECLSRFWELYLGCVLLESGFSLIPREKRSREGPDFCIEQGDSYLWIEATVANIGYGEESNVLREEPPSDVWQIVPEENIVLRFCSRIKEKYEKYQRYLVDGIVSKNDSFIIAVNGSGLPIQFWYADEVPYPIRAVLPIGLPFVVINKKTKQIEKYSYQLKSCISKKSGSLVNTDIFRNEQYSFISGILFSNHDPFSCCTLEKYNFHFLRNNLATNPVSNKWFGEVVGNGVSLTKKVVIFSNEGRLYQPIKLNTKTKNPLT